jgi:hypothetical protein
LEDAPTVTSSDATRLVVPLEAKFIVGILDLYSRDCSIESRPEYYEIFESFLSVSRRTLYITLKYTTTTSIHILTYVITYCWTLIVSFSLSWCYETSVSLYVLRISNRNKYCLCLRFTSGRVAFHCYARLLSSQYSGTVRVSALHGVSETVHRLRK